MERLVDECDSAFAVVYPYEKGTEDALRWQSA